MNLVRFRYLLPLAVGLATAPVYFFAYQTNAARHFGIGRWDRSYLATPEAFYPPTRMEGPVRHPDGSVEVRDFVGRLTKSDATLRVPYRALRSPLELHVRCHRFGLGGTVSLVVNGHAIDDFVFAETSYPWAGIRGVVPQRVAESGPLGLRFRTTGGTSPPSHLPQELGIGIDWVEVSPMSEGVVLLPTPREWLAFFLLLVSAYVFSRFLSLSLPRTAFFLAALALAVSLAQVVYPVTTSKVSSFGWMAFLGVVLLTWTAELVDVFLPSRREPRPAREEI